MIHKLNKTINDDLEPKSAVLHFDVSMQKLS